MTKQDVMNTVYTKEQLRNIDASLPIGMGIKDTFWYVINYNNNILGKLENMKQMYAEKKVRESMPQIVKDVIDGETNTIINEKESK